MTRPRVVSASRCARYVLWAMVALVLSGLPIRAQETPTAGLMWQRTGLPLVFPLVVTSAPGQDYVITLHDPGGGQAVFAAYVRGGEVFRVLAPPGSFDVRIAAGETWVDEPGLFGPGTRMFSLPAPLTFELAGPGIKAGHLIDLTGLARESGVPLTEARYICQTYAVESFPRPLPPFDGKGYETRLTDPGTLVRRPGAGFDPDRIGQADRPVIPNRFAPYFSDPTVSLRSLPCDPFSERTAD